MKISVVTPSYNQGQYIEETIDSVLSQGIAKLEYIIMDGGSTDNTVDILRKYDKHISYWISKPDGGQSNAIASGFEKSTGDVLCWLNSDDVYMPGVLHKVVHQFKCDENLHLLYGDYLQVYPDGRLVAKPKISYDFNVCLNAFMMVPQPSSFWSRRIYNNVGGLNTKFQYCFDYDFFLRVGAFLAGQDDSIKHIHDIWSKFRIHDESKTVSGQKFFSSETKIIRRQFNFVSSPPFRQIIKTFYLAKALSMFRRERGFVPLSSGPKI